MATVHRTLQTDVRGPAPWTPSGPTMAESAYRRCSRNHHLDCRGCGLAVEVTGPPVEAWTARVAAEHGFTGASQDWSLRAVRRVRRQGRQWPVMIISASDAEH